MTIARPWRWRRSIPRRREVSDTRRTADVSFYVRQFQYIHHHVSWCDKWRSRGQLRSRISVVPPHPFYVPDPSRPQLKPTPKCLGFDLAVFVVFEFRQSLHVNSATPQIKSANRFRSFGFFKFCHQFFTVGVGDWGNINANNKTTHTCFGLLKWEPLVLPGHQYILCSNGFLVVFYEYTHI